MSCRLTESQPITLQHYTGNMGISDGICLLPVHPDIVPNAAGGCSLSGLPAGFRELSRQAILANDGWEQNLPHSIGPVDLVGSELAGAFENALRHGFLRCYNENSNRHPSFLTILLTAKIQTD